MIVVYTLEADHLAARPAKVGDALPDNEANENGKADDQSDIGSDTHATVLIRSGRRAGHTLFQPLAEWSNCA